MRKNKADKIVRFLRSMGMGATRVSNPSSTGHLVIVGRGGSLNRLVVHQHGIDAYAGEETIYPQVRI